MTGFARSEHASSGLALSWELRSVNHRYLDLSLRLPEAWRRCEPEFRQAVGARVARGKLDATLRIETIAAPGQGLALDEVLLERLLGAVDRLGKDLPARLAIDPVELLRWPGLVRDAEPAVDQLQPLARATLDAALAELDAARQREGERLAELIRQRLEALTNMVQATRRRLPAVQEAIHNRLRERVTQLGGQVDEERLEQELVMLAQRMDVAEELDRLDGHVEEIAAVLQRDEPAGRRLDFLMQELNREANTLASKVQDLETTRLAVDMKVVIEQLREQAQNVE